ncbi:MAG: fasciclin domain-containing protein, partial [Thermoguttaceae bacterium]|nr:fasciclin domain-containing protein [Thermoguttaceae bacterium]
AVASDAAGAADGAKEHAKAAVETAKENVEQAAKDAKEKTEAAAEVAKEQLDAGAQEGQEQAKAVADAAKDAIEGAKADAAAKTPVKPRMYNYNASTLSCVMQCPECAVFSRAIHESGLEELIGGARRITIFAPTDEAFARWPQESLEQLFDCQPALAAIVLNHICPESLSPAELTKLQRLACCCNYDACVKYCGKKRADELALHCDAIADKTKEQQEVCDRNGGVGLGDGDLCAAASFPAPVVRCVNGYVYPIDRVQVPRGLKVYQALKSQEEQAPEEALEFELVEILIPSETLQPQAEETKDNEEMKKDEEKKNGNGKKENGKNGKNGAKADDKEMKAEKETKADEAKAEKETKEEKAEAKDKDKKDEKAEKSDAKDKDKKDAQEKKDKDDDKDDEDEDDDKDEKK